MLNLSVLQLSNSTLLVGDFHGAQVSLGLVTKLLSMGGA